MLAGPWRTHWRDNSLKMILRRGGGIKDSCAVLCVFSRHHKVYMPWFILIVRNRALPRFIWKFIWNCLTKTSMYTLNVIQATKKSKSGSESLPVDPFCSIHIKCAFCLVRTRDSCTFLFQIVVNITYRSHLFGADCDCLWQALEWNVPFLHSWSYYQNHYSCCRLSHTLVKNQQNSQ